MLLISWHRQGSLQLAATWHPAAVRVIVQRALLASVWEHRCRMAQHWFVICRAGCGQVDLARKFGAALPPSNTALQASASHCCWSQRIWPLWWGLLCPSRDGISHQVCKLVPAPHNSTGIRDPDCSAGKTHCLPSFAPCILWLLWLVPLEMRISNVTANWDGDWSCCPCSAVCGQCQNPREQRAKNKP